MTTTLRLHDALADLVRRLYEVIQNQGFPADLTRLEAILAPVLTRPDEDRLRAGLERALVSPDYLRAYLRHIDTLVKRPSPYREPLEDARVQTILKKGLAELTTTELGVLAISPQQLLALRDVFADEDDLSPDWTRVVRSAMRQHEQETRRPLPSVEGILQALRQTEGHKEPAGSAAGGSGPEDREPLMSQALSLPPADEATPRAQTVRWRMTVPRDQIEWLQREDEASARPIDEIVLEVFWQPQHPHQLEVQFAAGPFVAADCGFELTRDSEKVLGRIEGGTVVFEVAAARRPEDFYPRTLVCEYRRAGALQLRFAVSLQPTGPQP